MLSQVEALIEGASGKATMQDMRSIRFRVLLATDEQGGFSLDDLNLVWPRDRHADAMAVLARHFEVVGRPIRHRLNARRLAQGSLSTT